MATDFRIGGDGFRSPRRPTERIRYCKTCGPVSTRDVLERPLCDECVGFLAGRAAMRPGFRQHYLNVAREHGVTLS